MDAVTRSRTSLALGVSIALAFCAVSAYNQFRITDAMIALSPVQGSLVARLRVVSGWSAAVVILSHLALCFMLAMLIMGLARMQGTHLGTRNVITALGCAHAPLLLWAGYGAALFAGRVDKEHVEMFAQSIGRLMVARPFAYLGAVIWLVVLSVWQFNVATRLAAALAILPVLTIWAVLSILGWVLHAVPQ